MTRVVFLYQVLGTWYSLLVPTHLLFLNHVIRVDMTQTFGIQPIFPAFLPKQNRDYKRQNGSNQVAFL